MTGPPKGRGGGGRGGEGLRGILNALEYYPPVSSLNQP